MQAGLPIMFVHAVPRHGLSFVMKTMAKPWNAMLDILERVALRGEETDGRRDSGLRLHTQQDKSCWLHLPPLRRAFLKPNVIPNGVHSRLARCDGEAPNVVHCLPTYSSTPDSDLCDSSTLVHLPPRIQDVYAANALVTSPMHRSTQSPSGALDHSAS